MLHYDRINILSHYYFPTMQRTRIITSHYIFIQRERVMRLRCRGDASDVSVVRSKHLVSFLLPAVISAQRRGI